MKHISFRLKSYSTLVRYFTICIIVIAGSYTSSFAQQTCATKGNYPLPEISESAKNKLQQDLDAAIANLESNPTGLNELIWAGRRTAYL
ncbi:MAG: hypothetical protein RL253_836 [Bacteroidota bacterium]